MVRENEKWVGETSGKSQGILKMKIFRSLWLSILYYQVVYKLIKWSIFTSTKWWIKVSTLTTHQWTADFTACSMAGPNEGAWREGKKTGTVVFLPFIMVHSAATVDDFWTRILPDCKFARSIYDRTSNLRCTYERLVFTRRYKCSLNKTWRVMRYFFACFAYWIRLT